ncbi:hypothetical protein JCM12294_46000 [Desulfocicer niacini]
MSLKVKVHSKESTHYAREITTGGHKLVAERVQFNGGNDDKAPGPYSYLLAALGS